MKDYSEFPPFKYFVRVLKSCPRSALLYAQLWKKRSKQMNLVTEKRDVRKDYLISPTMFRNLLAPLMSLNLISFIESADKFQIDVLGPHLNE
jgi:hypothetical protein